MLDMVYSITIAAPYIEHETTPHTLRCSAGKHDTQNKRAYSDRASDYVGYHIENLFALRVIGKRSVVKLCSFHAV